MSNSVSYRKKLIEVALPLEAINLACGREKSIRHGHPSTLHLWWARRPLAAARAVIFAQMVDDPSSWPELFPTEAAQENERLRLFGIIEELVRWESTTNEEVLERARKEICENWRRTCEDNADHPQANKLFDPEILPAFHDPFAGGGAIPLEAQRLGLEANASDLNPVAVLINKAMIEIPPKYANQPPVNPQARESQELFDKDWKGAEGLAEDVHYYGTWIRERAEERIGHLYPRIKISSEMVQARPDLQPYEGQELKVIAWLWARTVKSPNPAFAHVDVPLISSFMLSTKKGKEAYVTPIVEGDSYRFEVRVGQPEDIASTKAGTKLKKGGFRCLLSNSEVPISFDYIRGVAKREGLGETVFALVVEGVREKLFISASPETFRRRVNTSLSLPDVELPEKALGFRVQEYGVRSWRDLFNGGHQVALRTFAELVSATINEVENDARQAFGTSMERARLEEYARAIGVYLCCALSRAADYWNRHTTWEPGGGFISHLFTRHAIPMVWDYPEANPFSQASGCWDGTALEWVVRCVKNFHTDTVGHVTQAAAQTQEISRAKVVSSDPPYFDNIGYADLSDFFYYWLRQALGENLSSIFSTISVPKREEIIADPSRHHDSAEEAEAFFLVEMRKAISKISEQILPGLPFTLYYAFKQAEKDQELGVTSTGWEAFLEAVVGAGNGIVISGTVPIKTERGARTRGLGSNALASSVVLVCRSRSMEAPTTSKRSFLRALKAELPLALRKLQQGNVAPVDLAQSAIGPGMAVFTRYAKVLNADGSNMSVRDALIAINQVLDETLSEQEGDFDVDTRWALAWFEQFGFTEGDYGVAETLSKAKNTSVRGAQEAGILLSKGGKVRLLSPDELDSDWDPEFEKRLTVWEIVHHLIRVLNTDGESGTAALVSKLGSKAEVARELCYRLYQMCERKKRAADALAYNALVQSFPEVTRLAQEMRTVAPAGVGTEQGELFR